MFQRMCYFLPGPTDPAYRKRRVVNGPEATKIATLYVVGSRREDGSILAVQAFLESANAIAYLAGLEDRSGLQIVKMPLMGHGGAGIDGEVVKARAVLHANHIRGEDLEDEVNMVCRLMRKWQGLAKDHERELLGRSAPEPTLERSRR